MTQGSCFIRTTLEDRAKPRRKGPHRLEPRGAAARRARSRRPGSSDIVEAAGDDLEVYVDGGVRTGIDVLRALALGARATLIGRPYLWALAVDGEQGVRDLLTRFKTELHNAMALAGQTAANRVDRSIVVLDR